MKLNLKKGDILTIRCGSDNNRERLPSGNVDVIYQEPRSWSSDGRFYAQAADPTFFQGWYWYSLNEILAINGRSLHKLPERKKGRFVGERLFQEW